MKWFIKILLIILCAAIAVGAVFLLGYSKQKNDARLCRSMSCTIDYNGSIPLITHTEIETLVIKKFGEVKKLSIGNINTKEIADYIKKNPYLNKTHVLLTIEGDLQIHVKQNIPLIRFITPANQQHYLSTEGYIMPINAIHPCKTIIATGEIWNTLSDGRNIFSIPDTNQLLRQQHQNLYNIHYLANIIKKDSILNALIEQINISNTNKIELATKAGSHLIVFGDTSFAAEKLNNLKHFYKQGLVKTGWNKYSKLNLTYRNQIVCTK